MTYRQKQQHAVCLKEADKAEKRMAQALPAMGVPVEQWPRIIACARHTAYLAGKAQ